MRGEEGRDRKGGEAIVMGRGVNLGGRRRGQEEAGDGNGGKEGMSM